MAYYSDLRRIFNGELPVMQLVSDRNYTKIITPKKSLIVGKNLSWMLRLLAEEMPNLTMVKYRKGEAVNVDFVEKKGENFFFQNKIINVSRRQNVQINKKFNELYNSNRSQSCVA